MFVCVLNSVVAFVAVRVFARLVVVVVCLSVFVCLCMCLSDRCVFNMLFVWLFVFSLIVSLVACMRVRVFVCEVVVRFVCLCGWC